jgi:hypothetical protein
MFIHIYSGTVMKTKAWIIGCIFVLALALLPSLLPAALSDSKADACFWTTGAGTSDCKDHILLYKEGWGCMACSKPCGTEVYHCSSWSLDNCDIRPTSAPTYPFGIDG